MNIISLLDDVTRKELKINDYDKQNIYYLLRWIIQNYHSLWTKDNLSMDHKRLRCNECASALLTMEVSKRIYKESSKYIDSISHHGDSAMD